MICSSVLEVHMATCAHVEKVRSENHNHFVEQGTNLAKLLYISLEFKKQWWLRQFSLWSFVFQLILLCGLLPSFFYFGQIESQRNFCPHSLFLVSLTRPSVLLNRFFTLLFNSDWNIVKNILWRNNKIQVVANTFSKAAYSNKLKYALVCFVFCLWSVIQITNLI